jgi:hypothetical protein
MAGREGTEWVRRSREDLQVSSSSQSELFVFFLDQQETCLHCSSCQLQSVISDTGQERERAHW